LLLVSAASSRADRIAVLGGDGEEIQLSAGNPLLAILGSSVSRKMLESINADSRRAFSSLYIPSGYIGVGVKSGSGGEGQACALGSIIEATLGMRIDAKNLVSQIVPVLLNWLTAVRTIMDNLKARVLPKYEAAATAFLRQHTGMDSSGIIRAQQSLRDLSDQEPADYLVMLAVWSLVNILTPFILFIVKRDFESDDLAIALQQGVFGEVVAIFLEEGDGDGNGSHFYFGVPVSFLEGRAREVPRAPIIDRGESLQDLMYRATALLLEKAEQAAVRLGPPISTEEVVMDDADAPGPGGADPHLQSSQPIIINSSQSQGTVPLGVSTPDTDPGLAAASTTPPTAPISATATLRARPSRSSSVARVTISGGGGNGTSGGGGGESAGGSGARARSGSSSNSARKPAIPTSSLPK
jgi:hypothetical protein